MDDVKSCCFETEGKKPENRSIMFQNQQNALCVFVYVHRFRNALGARIEDKQKCACTNLGEGGNLEAPESSD
jgi:hypothetical protein